MSNIAPSSQSTPRALIPPWLKDKWGFLGIFFIVYTLLDLAWTYFHWGGPQHVVLIANLFSFTPSLLSTILAWRVAAQKSLSMPLRRAWFILGLCFFMFLIGNLVWAYLELVLQVEPFPSSQIFSTWRFIRLDYGDYFPCLVRGTTAVKT